jgi:hypothetical protein
MFEVRKIKEGILLNFYKYFFPKKYNEYLMGKKYMDYITGKLNPQNIDDVCELMIYKSNYLTKKIKCLK